MKNRSAKPAQPTRFRRQWDAYQAGKLTYAEAFAPIAEAPPPTLSDKHPTSIWDDVNRRFKPKPPLSDEDFGGLP